MFKFPVMFLCITLLLGCSKNEWVRQHNADTNSGYFLDAHECSQSAMRKLSFLVPPAGSASAVELPIGYDANIFIVCMEHAGRPVSSRVDVTEYLKISTACLQEARDSVSSDQSYANCIRRSRLNVEVINVE